MTCSKNFGRSLQVACLGLIGTLALGAGCGGSENKPTGDGGPYGEGGPQNLAQLTIDKATVNMGTLDVNGTGVATVTVTNAGKANSGPVAVVASAGLTATGCSGALAAGASCTITITATPTAAGMFTGTVSISATPGATTPLQVSVIANVTPIGLFSVTPGAIDLGNVAVGVPAAPQKITVTAAVAITDLTVTSSGADVAIDRTASTCTTALLANASCIVVVNFTAVSAGAKSDSVVISGGGTSGKTVTVAITAVAQKPAALVVNPTTAQFAATVGQTSSAITFGVANTGDVPTGSISATITGANAADFKATSSCLILAPLAGCTVSVVFTPSAVSPPNAAASLVIADSTVGSVPVTVPLVGIGYSQSDLIITPVSGDVGSVLVGQVGAATTFTVTNDGDTASGNLTVAVSSTEFVVTNDTCTGASLAAKTGTCTISIALRPTAVGAKSATLTVTGANGAPGIKTLTGVGYTPGKLSATPASADFGSVRVNKIGTPQTITVKNEGGAPTGVLSFTKSGSFSQFPITANTCSAALGPAATCTFTVNFAPVEVDSYTASYTITDGNASATVLVSGSGLQPSGISIAPTGPVVSCTNPEDPTGDLLPEPCYTDTVINGQSNTETFTVTADSAAEFPAGLADTGALTVALGGTNSGDFKVVTDGCTGKALLPSASCTIAVAFAPTAVGALQAALNVTSANGGAASVTLQSTGLALIELRADDVDTKEGLTGLDFGQVPLLADVTYLPDKVVPSHSYTVIVRGPNNATTHTSAVLATLTDPSQPADFSYNPTPWDATTVTNRCNTAANTAVTLDFSDPETVPSPWAWDATREEFSCSFRVYFYPQSTKGDKTATLTATGSANATDSKAITGTAVGLLVFDPSPVNFATDWTIGSSSNIQTGQTITMVDGSENNRTVTLWNYSNTTEYGPVSLTLAGANADQFLIVDDQCTAVTLKSQGDNCTVTLAFVPTSAGLKTATLDATAGDETASVVINGGSADSFDITIAPNQMAANLAVLPDFDTRKYAAPFDFGTVAQGGGSEWKAFTVTNPAGSPRSAQVTYSLYDDSEGLFVLANGGNHALGTCGLSGSTTLAPGASCTILVQFKPSLGTSPSDPLDKSDYQRAIVKATDAAKQVTVQAAMIGHVGSAITMTPAAYTFPDTAEGQTSTTTLTVKNNALVAVNLSIQPNGSFGPFSVDQNAGCYLNKQVAAGATCPLVVNFVGVQGAAGTPGAKAPNSLTVGAIEATDGTATTDLTGTTIKDATLVAVGFPAAASSVQGAQVIDLGGVRKNYQSGDVTLTFQNIGSVPTGSLHYKWSNVAADTADSEFLIVNESATGCVGKTSLAAGATCTVTVHFSPSLTSVAGPRDTYFVLSATPGGVVQIFRFHAQALEQSGSGYIAISGSTNGFFAFPGKTPSPAPATPPSQIFQMTNTTSGNVSAAVSFESLSPSSLSDDFVVDPAAGTAPCATAGTLTPSSSCTFAVKFTPTAYKETFLRFGYVVASDAALAGVKLGVTGRVQSPADLVLTPAKAPGDTYDFDFGQVVRNQTASKAFTLTNPGETATTGTLSIVVGDTVHFSQTSTCGTSLAAGASCTVTVTFAPGTMDGPWSTPIGAIADNAEAEPVVVYGYGVQDTAVGLTPSATLAFADEVPVGTTSEMFNDETQTVVVTNLAGARTSGLLTLTLGDAVNFEILDTNCPLASDSEQKYGLGTVKPYFDEDMTPMGTCQVVLNFKPQSLGTNGTLSTTLTVTSSPGGTQSVSITGKAISALTTNYSPGPVANVDDTIDDPFIITVEIAPLVPQTSFLKTSLTGSDYRIVWDSCVATKLDGSTGTGPYACEIAVALVTSAATPRTTTLTVNGGSAGQSVSLVLNSGANP